MILDKTGQQAWTNWSGSIRFTPQRIEAPYDEEALSGLIRLAAAENRTIRAVGSSHSCSPIFQTDDVLLSMENFKGLHAYDPQRLTATVGAGMTVEEVGKALHQVGLGMENTGHIDQQALAGAVSTGTHGAGKKLPNLSGQVVGLRLLNAQGEAEEYTLEKDPTIMQALRVSLGSLGIFTQITLKVLPAFQLHRQQYCASVADCLEHLTWLMEYNRNFCFYWYPRRDDVSIRLWNPPGEGTQKLPFPATLYKEETGWGKDVLPSAQELRFDELEYSVDASVAVACFQEVRRRILEKHRSQVAWRVLFRPVAEDDVYLSNSYGHNTVAITIHQNATLPYEEYFYDIEPIFQAYGGRPHWAKKHSMTASGLKHRYPQWARFQETRSRMDPQGLFLNKYLQNVLIEP